MSAGPVDGAIDSDLHWLELEVLGRDLVMVRGTDAHPHVIHHVVVGYLGEARSMLLARLSGEGEPLPPMVVAEVQCRYLSPLLPGERFKVGIRVIRVGRSSINFGYEVVAADRPVANGESVEVFVDPVTQRARSIPDHLRDRLLGLTRGREADSAVAPREPGDDP